MIKTRFIPIRLIGVGTSEIESASSYAMRLAMVHGLSVTQMADVLNDILLSDSEVVILKPIGTVGRQKLSTFCRPSPSTYQFNIAVSRYIGETRINRASILPICPGMPDTPWFFVGGTRWCPCCLQDDVASKVEPYLRLKWQTGHSNVCLRHWVKLRSHCTHCNASQDVVTHYRERFTHCYRCEGSLLNDPEPCDDSMLTSAEWDAHDFVELQSSGYKFSWRAIHSAMLKVVDRELGGIDGMLRWEEETDRTVKFTPYLNDISNVPGLFRLMQFCQLTEIPLHGLLTGQPYPVQRSLIFKPSEQQQGIGLGKRRDKHRDHQNLYKQAVSLASDHSPPLSVRQIAKKLRVSAGYIEHRWPNLVATTVKRSAEYRDAKMLKEAIEAEKLVCEFFNQCQQDHSSFSVHRAARTLMKTSGLSRPTLERAAQRCLARNFD